MFHASKAFQPVSRCVVAWSCLDLIACHPESTLAEHQPGTDRTRWAVVVLTARERAAEAGAAALRPVASARLRASVLRQSGAPTLLARADCRSKVQFVEAQCGARCEHEVMTTMDKARCLQGGDRVDHF